MPISIDCKQCGKTFQVVPARSNAKFCSNECRYKGHGDAIRGESHGRYLAGVVRTKNCEGCGANMDWKSGQKANYGTWAKQKFCSKPCADEHGFRRSGGEHPLFRADSRRKTSRGKHGAWARKVISRDGGACKQCGSREGLHAHHIKPFSTHPELRLDVENGITLCFVCHHRVHAALDENAVNSVDTLTSKVEGNTEPSFGRKPIEGVTTRGRAYRRWEGSCEWCNAFISRPWSDVKGKKHVCCSKVCAGKLKAATRTYRPAKDMQRPMAVISSTSPAPEREDIV